MVRGGGGDGGGARSQRVRVRTARGRPTSSTRWLSRQLNDPYVQRAREEGYRSRSAYKLIELDGRFGLLRPGARVVDLGAAPGGWSQVAAQRGCRVVALDVTGMDPVPGATVLRGDFLDEAVQARLLAELGGSADVVLSDMAASATGQRAVDRLRAEALGEATLDFALRVLAPGGACLIKLVRGGEAGLLPAARRDFATARLVRPPATRKESSEIYLLGQGFRGAATAAPEEPEAAPG